MAISKFEARKELYRRGKLTGELKEVFDELNRRGKLSLDVDVETIQPTEQQKQSPKLKGFRAAAEAVRTGEGLGTGIDDTAKSALKIYKEMVPQKDDTLLENIGDAITLGIPGYKYAKPATKFLPKLLQRIGSQAASSTATGAGSYLAELGKGATQEEARRKGQTGFVYDTALGGGLGAVGLAGKAIAKGGKKATGIRDKVWDLAKKYVDEVDKAPITEEAARKTAIKLQQEGLKRDIAKADLKMREGVDELSSAQRAEQKVIEATQDLQRKADALETDFYSKIPLEKQMVASIPDYKIQSEIKDLKDKLKSATKEVTEEYYKANPTAKKVLKALKKMTERDIVTKTEKDLGGLLLKTVSKKEKAHLKKPESLLVAYNSLKDLYKKGRGLSQSQKAINKLIRNVRGILDNSPEYSRYKRRGEISVPIPKKMKSEAIGGDIYEPKKVRDVLESSVTPSRDQASNTQLIDEIYEQMGGNTNRKAIKEAVELAKDLKVKEKNLKGLKQKKDDVKQIPIEDAEGMVYRPYSEETKLLEMTQGDPKLLKKILIEDAARQTSPGLGRYRVPVRGKKEQQGISAIVNLLESARSSPKLIKHLLRNRERYENIGSAGSTIIRKGGATSLSRTDDGYYTDESKEELKQRRQKMWNERQNRYRKRGVK